MRRIRRHPWLVVSILALLGVMALGAFPARAYVEQLHQRQELAERAEALAQSNRRLVEQAERLQTDEVVERLARERFQLVRPGEEAYAILPESEPPPDAVAPAAPVAGAAAQPRSWWSRVWARLTSIF